MGKCWACWQGYQHATGDVLVFSDADTRHHPALLAHAVGALQRHKADLVSAFPRQLMFTFWERVIQPQVFTAIMLRYRDGERINRSRNPRNVIANGQFIAFPRTSYEAIGGHESVRAEVVEDLSLAQRVVIKGGHIHIAWADDLIATRMYRTLRAIVEGWSKNLARASRHTVAPWLRPILPWLVALFLLAFWAAPPLALLSSLFLPPAPPVGWSATATLSSIVFWLIMHRMLRISPSTAFLYPLGAIVTAGLFIRSTLLGEAITWKGRRYGS
jgi:chlorobactene glucosyltransferase